MSTKKCSKGLKKDKISGECVSLDELNARKKRSTTLKKIDKIDKKYDLCLEKVKTTQKIWLDCLNDTGKYRINYKSHTRKTQQKYKKLQNVETKLKTISEQLDVLTKIVGDIEEKYDIDQNEKY